jgi:transcriptional regulator with XRE-family HTH domain
MAAEAKDWYNADVATFGDRLTAAREAAGMDQATMAERVGVELQTLQNWEDDLAEPRANRLQMMAGILGVSITWLLSGEGEGVESPAPDSDEADVDAKAVLTELRDLRWAFTQKAEQVGRIEKRLRKYLQAKQVG